MSFEIPNQQEASTIKKYQNLCLTSIYFQHSGYKESELRGFNDQVTLFIRNTLIKKYNAHHSIRYQCLDRNKTLKKRQPPRKK